MLRKEESVVKYYISDNPNPRPSVSTFYQGITCSQTQIAKYVGERPILMTTGEYAICHGRNNLKPIDVLMKPYIGVEIKDVNTHPFDTLRSHLNPLKLFTASLSLATNWYQGIEVYDVNGHYKIRNSMNAHALNLSEISVGQVTDIDSHFEKHQLCIKENPDADVIAYGTSRGAATTVVTIAEKAQEVDFDEIKLVILEGCFRSLRDTLYFKDHPLLWSAVNNGLSLFTKYRKDGICPIDCVDKFPPGIPIAFVTSEKDIVVPSWSTRLLAEAFARRGLNDVYLLTLENSSHPNYMFDDATDRENYQNFVHALYKKYNLFYIPEYAEKGMELVEKCKLQTFNPTPAPSF